MKTWIMDHNRCFVGRPHFGELWLCLWGPLLNMRYTHMEVFPSSRRKTLWGLRHLRPQMWDSGKSCIFSHSQQKWWDDVESPPLTTFLNLHVFFITTPLNVLVSSLFSLALLATWYVLIHDHPVDKPEKCICVFLFHHVFTCIFFILCLSSSHCWHSLQKWMMERAR